MSAGADDDEPTRQPPVVALPSLVLRVALLSCVVRSPLRTRSGHAHDASILSILCRHDWLDEEAYVLPRVSSVGVVQQERRQQAAGQTSAAKATPHQPSHGDPQMHLGRNEADKLEENDSRGISS